MTETPIDRLARAAWGKTPTCDLQRVSKGPCSLDDECCCWRVAKDNIRAILREMREPSDEMLWAAHIKLPPATTQMRNRWRAMIDHILAEGAQ